MAPVSMIANLCMATGIVIIFYYITQDLPSVNERKPISSPSQMPLFFGTSVFAFEGIGVVSIHILHKDPEG